MKFLNPTLESMDWPSDDFEMEHHPILGVAKEGRIVYALLFKGRDQFGGLTDATDEVYDTGEYWTRPGRPAAFEFEVLT